MQWLYDSKSKVVRYLVDLDFKQDTNLYEKIFRSSYQAYCNFKKTRLAARLVLEARSLERKFFAKEYTYITIEEAFLWTNHWMKKIPSCDFDCIVGIPRSGLVIANIMAVRFAKPLTTPENFKRNEFWVSKVMPKKDRYQNILLVDDSIYEGDDLREVVADLKAYDPSLNIITAVLAATEENKHMVDYFYKTIPLPRIFDWDLMHRRMGGVVASDLDGVLCEDCDAKVDNDEERYVHWLKTASAYLIPSYELDYVITNRLEKYREITEAWLKEKGVRYKKLIMWDISCKSHRDKRYVKHKEKVLLSLKPNFYIESDLKQSKYLFGATRIPILCTDERILFR